MIEKGTGGNIRDFTISDRIGYSEKEIKLILTFEWPV